MTNEFKTIITNKLYQRLFFAVLLLVILGGVFCYFTCYFYDDSRKARYPKTSKVAEVEIRKICEELVLPDDFKKIRNEVAHTYHDRAFIGNRFASDLGVDEVKSFFVNQLSKKDWSFHEWSHLDGKTVFLRFEKEAYEISIECNKYSFSKGGKYNITCNW